MKRGTSFNPSPHYIDNVKIKRMKFIKGQEIVCVNATNQIHKTVLVENEVYIFRDYTVNPHGIIGVLVEGIVIGFWRDNGAEVGHKQERFRSLDEMCSIEEIETHLSTTAPFEITGKQFDNTKPFKPCGEGDNICNCKSESECGYLFDNTKNKAI